MKLAADQLYVVDCKVECVVRDPPKGLVRVAKKKGPRDFSAKFVDGAGGIEDRTYDGPFLYVVQAVGTGRVELDVIPVGFKSEAEIVTATVDVSAGQGPQPPPKPDPKPPEPSPDAPIPVSGLRVLVVFETADAAKLTAGQQQAIYSKATRDLLNANCVVGPDGKTREWRIFDQNVDASADSKTWADAMKRPRKSVPWLIVSNGTSGFEGPLVDDKQVADLVAKFGGK